MSTASFAGFQACGQGGSGLVAISSETSLNEAGTEHQIRPVHICLIFGERLNTIAGPGNVTLLGGVHSWSDFVSNASLTMPRQARDTAYYQVEGYQRSRERLKK